MTPDLEALILQAAQRYNLPPDIFRRQLLAESGGNVQAVSPKGAQGVAQFMPGTAQAFGIDPMKPDQAIPAAALYMRQHLNRYGDDWQKALAAYNWGPGNLAKYGITAAPPETRQYITKVLGGGPLPQSSGNVVRSNGGDYPAQGQPGPQMSPGPAGPAGPGLVPPPPPPEAMGGGSLANMLAQLAQQGRDINKIV